jgi:NADH:ubiquinone oxidoreductase subunit B-like Fe-S oxidoreductase
MTVVHFTKVSVIYPRVVISSLAKRLEKPHFYHSYTSFGVWTRDHYIPLQRFIMGCMPDLAKVVSSTIALLRFFRVVAVQRPLLNRVSLGE